MSLLTRVFSFLGNATYNPTPPIIANGQPASMQCDVNGRLLVTIAGITAGAPVLALPVATATRAIQNPTYANGYQVSAPFNTSAAVAFNQAMPGAPVRGMRVTVIDSGGFASVTPCTLVDFFGHNIQSPMNPASLATTLAFSWSGFAATWEFVTGDPTNGSFWAVVRSLQ